MQSRNLRRATPFAWAGTLATMALLIWAGIGLAQQEARVMHQCISAGASPAECQLRIYGR